MRDRSCACRRSDCHLSFAALAELPEGPRRAALRAQIVERHLDLARSVAARYRRGPGFEDIRQVAALALVEAVNRFDPAQGSAFSAFAVPTVLGAVKRYFRDNRWVLQTPRRLKQLRLEIQAVADELTQRLGHQPSARELAGHLGCTAAEVQAALHADDARHPLSLDAPVRTVEDGSAELGTTLGGADEAFEQVDEALRVRPLIARLPERERRVLTLRFFADLNQAQIAARVGCSQMHVSRILRGALDELRHTLADQAPRRGDMVLLREG